MKSVYYIYLKELKSYLFSPLAYILAAVFIFIVGFSFFNLLVGFVEHLQNIPSVTPGATFTFVESVIFRLYANMNFILFFLCPMITMRTFAEEKRQHSLELLLSSPVKDWQIIVGKWLAALTLIVFMMMFSWSYFPILKYSGVGDLSYFWFGQLGTFMNVVLYVALGVLASLLAPSQLLAALFSFLFLLFLWLMAWLSQTSSNYMLAEIFRYVSIVDHFENILKGLVNSTDLVYYLTTTLFVFVVSVKVLASRRW